MIICGYCYFWFLWWFHPFNCNVTWRGQFLRFMDLYQVQDTCFALEKMVSGIPGPKTTFSSSQERLALLRWANNLNKIRKHLNKCRERGISTPVFPTIASYHMLMLGMNKLVVLSHKYIIRDFYSDTKCLFNKSLHCSHWPFFSSPSGEDRTISVFIR